MSTHRQLRRPHLLLLLPLLLLQATQHTQETIGSCFADCRKQGYSLSIVATDWRCWCAIATPPPGAQADESACAQGSNKGALVFYHYEGK